MEIMYIYTKLKVVLVKFLKKFINSEVILIKAILKDHSLFEHCLTKIFNVSNDLAYATFRQFNTYGKLQ